MAQKSVHLTGYLLLILWRVSFQSFFLIFCLHSLHGKSVLFRIRLSEFRPEHHLWESYILSFSFLIGKEYSLIGSNCSAYLKIWMRVKWEYMSSALNSAWHVVKHSVHISHSFSKPATHHNSFYSLFSPPILYSIVFWRSHTLLIAAISLFLFLDSRSHSSKNLFLAPTPGDFSLAIFSRYLAPGMLYFLFSWII